jgi:hypothetical protein
MFGLLTTVCAAPATAQTLSNLQIQDTFEGKDANPATVAYVWPGGGQKSYSYVDVAIKDPLKDFHPWGDYSTIVPAIAIEWHRYDAEALLQQQKTSKLAPEILVDLAFGDVACVGADDPSKPCKRIRPFIATKYAIARDFLHDEWDGTLSALVSPFSIHPGYPGAFYPIGAFDRRLFRYTPSVGIERFTNPAITDNDNVVVAPKSSAWTLTALLDAEIWPFNVMHAKPEYLQRISLRFQGSFRKPFAGDGAETLNAMMGAITYYLDEADRFGLSLTHDQGRSPNANFVDRRRDVLAFTVRLGSN